MLPASFCITESTPRQINMAKKKAASDGPSNGTAANLGFEAQLWLTADKLRNKMVAAEYKHVVLGLIFLNYISDDFEERHRKLLAEVSDGGVPEVPDEYRADNVFWVPTEARWQTPQDNAKQSTIGKLIDKAMVEIDRDNSRLKGILPKCFRLGRTAGFRQAPLGQADRRDRHDRAGRCGEPLEEHSGPCLRIFKTSRMQYEFTRQRMTPTFEM